jgi:hypothetical protein
MDDLQAPSPVPTPSSTAKGKAKAKAPPLASSSGARRRFDESKERIAKKEREDKQASLNRSLQRRIEAKEVAADGSPMKRPPAGAGAGKAGLSWATPLRNKQAADIRMKGMPAGTRLWYRNQNGKIVQTKPQTGVQAGRGRLPRRRQMAQKQPPKRKNPGPPPGPPPGAK